MADKTVDFSSGFKDDLNLFVASVKKLCTNTPADQSLDEFNCFCETWRKMNFHFIFHGRSDYELIAFTEDCLNIAKHLFLNAPLELDKITAFYMLYAIYFKQPTEKFVKIRFKFDQWLKLQTFVKQQERNYQIQLVFWKLFREDAFRFVYHELEMGLESMYNSGRIRPGAFRNNTEDVSEKTSIFQLMSDIENLQNQKSGLLTALDIIEIGYNDMKEKLESTTNPLVSKDQNLALLPQSNFGTDIHKSLAAIAEALEQRCETENVSPTPAETPASSVCNIESMSSDDLASTEEEETKRAVGQRRQILKRKAFQTKAKELRTAKEKAKRVARARLAEKRRNEMKKDRDEYSMKLHRRKSTLALMMASSSASCSNEKIYKIRGKNSENGCE